MKRPCRKPRCSGDAAHTLSFDYATRVVVAGPLSPVYDPTALDLCTPHARDFQSPRGWTLVRYREPTEGD